MTERPTAKGSVVDGVIVLAVPDLTYADGAEANLLEIVRSATDLSSTSEELRAQGTTWARRYHLDTSRANVLRAFDLPAGATVLEVGAGCGAITRYLGETCARVDALEPMIDRARVARERTRDLPGVRVLLGELADLPPEPTYDVVVVIGVLEYVGDGTAGDPAYGDFLAEIHRRLKPGGQLILAIENKLGVKYLAGAPEDHTERPYEGIEDYPVSNGVRTFARAELGALMAGADLASDILIAFPDYKMTRAVMAPGTFPAGTRSLLTRLPVFPSPDEPRPAPRAFDEAAGWRVLVDAGLAEETGNSFVVVATKGDGSAELWPADRAAVYFSAGRVVAQSTRTAVVRDGAGLRFDRQPLSPAGPAVTGPRLVAGQEAYVDGESLVDVIARDGLDGARGLLAAWVAAVEAEPAALDLVPHNVVVTPAGTLVPVDQEWRDPAADPARVLRRGVLLLAEGLIGRASPVWPPKTTVGDVARAVAEVVGLPEGWLDLAIAEEARFNALAAAARPDLDGPERVEFFETRHRDGLWTVVRPDGVAPTCLPALVHGGLVAGAQDPAGAAWERAAREADADAEVALLLAIAQGQRRDLQDQLTETRKHATNLEDLVAALRAEAAGSAALIDELRRHVQGLEEQRVHLARESATQLEEIGLAARAATERHAEAEARAVLREAELTEARANLAGALAELQKVYASPSWRLTRPLRAIRGWLR